MARGQTSCIVCDTGADEAVNELLTANTPLVQIAALVKISKSAIGRHSLRCYARANAAAIGRTHFDPSKGRVVTKWGPGRSPVADSQYTIVVTDRHGRSSCVAFDPADLREADVLISIVYDDPIPPRPAPSEPAA